MTFDQWWEQESNEMPQEYKFFCSECWKAAIKSAAPTVEIGRGASVSGMVLIQPQKKEST